MKTQKILLSIIPAFLSITAVINFLIDFNIDLELYNFLWSIMLILVIVFYIILLKVIWSEKKTREFKIKTTLLVLVFAPFSLFYIWGVMGDVSEEEA